MASASNSVRDRIESDDTFLDSAVVGHGFAPFLRDYDVTIDVPAALPDGTGSYIARRVRYRFTHCVEADARTAVSPTTWQASWADLFTSRATWQRAGEPDGYLWGVEWADANPGLKYVDQSDLADTWTRRLSHQMHEATIETNAWTIRLVFHDLVVNKLGEFDPETGQLATQR